MQNYLKYLFNPIEPYEKNYLKVDQIHQIYYEISGNPNGQAILYVHGGPGGGTSKISRRFFDPQHYKIVLFDQRGCGKSQPFLELKNNTTWDLVEDIEKLRKKLKIKKWILFGGSWGTTLSLLYAIKYPENVSKMILRGVFLGRKKDISWLYQEGASYFKPYEYQEYINLLNKKQQKNIVASYYHLIHSDNKQLKEKALLAWAKWETMLVSVNKIKFNPKNLKNHSALALLENWYFYHNCFIEENYILNNIEKIKDIPTFIVHGEYDLDCLPSAAFELHQKLLNSKLFLIKKSGHSQSEIGITKKLVELTNFLKNNIKST
ncbi:prolyl aminopeptidase [Mycoplasma sp. 744]|uniref:prolyl aminopeptidase n=1 Tax=Mycoplasma sp. 744 TaxID=3108531 RepID=UPI002B1D8AEF|nr:prolyl aminopeptidase [Mycoplasma sp. 744]MEA4115431.1 prolyl aminopeptidase [Mycoplasma sp. 744]